MTEQELRQFAHDRRMDVVEMVHNSGAGHIGGDMSVMEILTVLYCDTMNFSPANADNPDRDRLFLSKGHCADAQYAILGELGFFDKGELIQTFSAFNSPYIGHPSAEVNGIEASSGSLGHGLALGVGTALAGKMDGRSYRTYVVLGDGEMAEGSNYEAMMAAAQYKLDNLCATVDLNGLQISGTTDEVMSTASLAEKFRAFGWNVVEVENGNDVAQLRTAYAQAAGYKGAPTAVIAHTTKGRGVSFMENVPAWHHGVLNAEQYAQAKQELEGAKV